MRRSLQIRAILKRIPKEFVNERLVAIPRNMVSRLGIGNGDLIEISSGGNKIFREVMLSPYEVDHGRNIVRIDKSDRDKLESSLEDSVLIKKLPIAQYLFSYGSNHPGQLKDRLGRSVDPIQAWLPNYGRVFRGYSRNWNGSVASLIRDRTRTVYGFVVPIGSGDIKKLDRFEGVRSGAYKRAILPIQTNNGIIKANVYVSTSQDFSPPSQRYLKAIIKTISFFWKNEDGSDVTIDDIPLV
jgi:gamma-glutamylcyclotransferase (GGCT)/AIG2-like uncharacterized protein YtfP